MLYKFVVGDKVRTKGCDLLADLNVKAGMEGVVKCVARYGSTLIYGVTFKEDVIGHNLSNLRLLYSSPLEEGNKHGIWFVGESLELVK